MSSSLQVLHPQVCSTQFQKFHCDPFQMHSVYAKTNILVLELVHAKKYKKIKHDVGPARKSEGELENVFDMEMKNREDPDYVDEESKIDCRVISLNT